jgi:hypothetical protein
VTNFLGPNLVGDQQAKTWSIGTSGGMEAWLAHEDLGDLHHFHFLKWKESPTKSFHSRSNGRSRWEASPSPCLWLPLRAVGAHDSCFMSSDSIGPSINSANTTWFLLVFLFAISVLHFISWENSYSVTLLVWNTTWSTSVCSPVLSC